MSHFIAIPESGEEIYLMDLLAGIDALPPRQRQAFELICLQGYTETDATRIMLPHSRWSTPIQQYADTALVRMVAAYDATQAGTYIKTVYVKSSGGPRRSPEGGDDVSRRKKKSKADAPL